MSVLRSVATALPKCSKQGGRWGLMVVGQSGALRSDLDRISGWLVGGDGGMARALEKTEGKSACGPITQFAQQNREHCAQELRLR